LQQGDRISVSADLFGGGLNIGSLPSSQFTTGSTATDGDDRFIYNSTTGALFFDSDGTGAIGQVQIVTLSQGLTLNSDAISITATNTFNSTLILDAAPGLAPSQIETLVTGTTIV
jgi:hypothetical protein